MIKEEDFFGEGVPLRDDFVLKAHLRVPVRPFEVDGVQGVAETLSALYEGCARDVREAVASAARREPLAKSPRLVLVADEKGGLDDFDLAKAAGAPTPSKASSPSLIHNPGIRGGKWWRDKSGKIRYGKKPKGKPGKDLSHGEVRQHLAHFRPSTLAPGRGDAHLVGHLRSRGGNGKFSPGELDFLDWWHSHGVRSLVEGYGGLSTDDLHDGLASLRLEDEADGPLSYEEAAARFFEDQDWGDANYATDVEPIIADLMARYHDEAEGDEAAESIERRTARVGRAWFAEAASQIADVQPTADLISSTTDPYLTASRVLAALQSLDLIRALQGEGIAAAMPNEEILSESKHRLGILLQQKFGQKFSSLSSAQLMLAYIGSGLNAIWEPKSQTYFVGAGVPRTDLGQQALGALSDVSGLGARIKILQPSLDDAVVSAAIRLNGAAVA